jgi:V8-like Glu-specific endopeptidase
MPVETLDKKLRDRVVDTLAEVPATRAWSGRDALLDGIPHNVRGALNRDENNQFNDLTNIVSQLDRLGRLDNGERPVVIVIHNAWRITRGTDVGRRLEEIQRDAEAAYGGEKPFRALPAQPEVLIFSGPGEWVGASFFEQAQLACRRVARLMVPRFIAGREASGLGLGTGWLVAPRLMLTNHHVIVARDENEPPPSEADFRRQSESVTAWFDYHREGQDHVDVKAVALVSSSETLDYALLRLAEAPLLADRQQLVLVQGRPNLGRGTRLNIVQCPGGGPLTFAIRNNFYVGPGEQAYHLRYLTDTREGSSGSPVLDDKWQVLAMHHGARRVDPKLYQGDAGMSGVVKFHNEGTAIQDILDHLPGAARDEIRQAQGWN